MQDFGLNTSETEWEQVLDCWKLFSHHVNHLKFYKYKINERQLESFLCSCTSLVSLTVNCCDCADCDTDSLCDLINLANVSHLEIKDSSLFYTETSLIKLTNFMPKLAHLSRYLYPRYYQNSNSTDFGFGIAWHIIEPRFTTIISIDVCAYKKNSDHLVCLLKLPDLRLALLNLDYQNFIFHLN